jgi:tetratricopeptide (TPR) repeat protein
MHQPDTRPSAAPAEPPALPRVEGYELIELVGEGGMGRVYRARQLSPQREVALKLLRGLDRDAVQRFRREAELLATLEHPGIARLYAAGDADFAGVRLPWLALEFVRGDDLGTHARRRELDLRQRVALVASVCRAVHHAHGRGVIHRDLKPGNILVDEHGQPRVLDFGIARIRGEDGGVTQAGQVLGTLPYMSPEQLGGGGRGIDVRSDVYALGVIAYQLVSGQLPHPGLSQCTLFEAIDVVRHQTPPRLASVAPATRGDLDAVVMKALAQDPGQRYGSAAEFAADLERVLDHRPVDARAPTPGYLLARFMRRHRVASAAAAMVLGVLMAATAVSLDFAWSEREARRVAEERRAEADAINGFLEQMLTSADPEQALGRDLRVADILDQAATGMEQAKLPPLVASRLQRTLGRTYLNLGDGERAAALLASAARRLTGADETEAKLRHDLALDAVTADIERDKLAEARATLDALLAPDSGLDAEQRAHASLLRSHVLQAQGDLAASETLLRGAVADTLARFGPDHALTLNARHNLSAVLQQAEKLEEAATIAEDVLRRRLGGIGPDHPDTLKSMNHLAAVQLLMGRREEAEKLMRETIAARTRVLGAKHPSTLVAQGNLAVLLIQTGRLEEGRAVAEPVAAAWAEIRGEHASRTLAAKQMLAYVYEDLGRLDDAERLLRAIVATQVAEGGPSGPSVLSPRNDLGMLLLKRGRAEDALVEFDALMAWATRMLEPEHLMIAIFRSNRGECLARLGRLADARAELEAAHTALAKGAGAEHPRTKTAAERLAAVYRRLGLDSQADALTRKA